MLKMDRPNRLGRASLETLAIIAYRQPLTKSEIEDIRGVDVSANIKTLMELQLIRLVGKSELPGHPFLYGTTPLFLEHFGLSSLQQLNELDPTLQRSNPKKKAESYKRVEKKTELEDAAQPAADEKTEAGNTSDEENVEAAVAEVEATAEGAPAEEREIFIDDASDGFEDGDEADGPGEDEEDDDEYDEDDDEDEYDDEDDDEYDDEDEDEDDEEDDDE
jgi:segregation and condensation protein B